MVDVEKRKEELRVILAEMERDIEMLQANISKLRKDMDGVNTETDLAALEELQRTRWIPVTERLPEKLEAVNIVWKNNNPEPYYENIKGKAFVATGYYYNGNWYWFSVVCEDFLKKYGKCPMDVVDEGIDITHWMPLPCPPKENRNE